MTHNDIYTKFLIEYDKANVTSSYPALTPYEIATILDRAYQALIARKLTGNNPRRSTFESDTKSIEDLRPLVVTSSVNLNSAIGTAENEYVYSLPQKLLYFLESDVDYSGISGAADGKSHKREVVDLVSHSLAKNFTATTVNMPWIKRPVAFIEDDKIHILVDSYKHPDGPSAAYVTYIKQFNKFAGSGSEESVSNNSTNVNTPILEYDDNEEYNAPSIITTNVEQTGGHVVLRVACTTSQPNCTGGFIKSNSKETLSNGVLSSITATSTFPLTTGKEDVSQIMFTCGENEYYVQYVVLDSNNQYIGHSPVMTIPKATESSSPEYNPDSGQGSGSGGSGSGSISGNVAVFDFKNIGNWRNMMDFSFSDEQNLEMSDYVLVSNRTLTVGPVSIKIIPSGDKGSKGEITKVGNVYGLHLGIYCKLEISVSGGYSLQEIQIPDDVQGTFIDILGWDTAHQIWTAQSGGIQKAVYQNGWMDNNLYKIIVKYGI